MTLPLPVPPPLLALPLTAAAHGPGSSEVGNAWALFAIIATLLIAFFGAIALVSLMRWRRQRQDQPKTPVRDTDVDAWEESARRTEPY